MSTGTTARTSSPTPRGHGRVPGRISGRVAGRLAGAASAARRRPGRTALLCAGLLGAVVVLSLCLGARAIPPAEVWVALVAPTGSDDHVVVRDLRVPRTLLGLAVGASLGVAGALVQGHTRNPLSDPGLLGLGAGAAFAVVLGIQYADVTHPLGYVWFAFAGALLCGVAVFALGSAGPRGSTPLTLALAGAALTALLGALTTAVVLMAPENLDGFRRWTVGSIAGRGTEVLTSLAPFMLAGLVLALANTRAMNALSLGEDAARALGLRVGWARGTGMAALTLLTGAAVASAGPVALVGLVVPHAARALTGPDYRRLVPLSAVLGGCLVLAADVVGRVVAPPGELEVGVVLAVVGAPVLVALVRRRRPVAL